MLLSIAKNLLDSWCMGTLPSNVLYQGVENCPCSSEAASPGFPENWENDEFKFFTCLNWKKWLPHRVPTKALGAYLPQLASTLPSSSQCSSAWKFGSHPNKNNFVNLPRWKFHENASLPFQVFGAGASRARLHRNLPTSFSLGIISKYWLKVTLWGNATIQNFLRTSILKSGFNLSLPL